MKTTAVLAAGTAAAVLALTGCSSDSSKDDSGSSTAEANILTHDASGITQGQVKPMSAPRLAAGLVPPTNKWFSGLVFGDKAQPVFPLPIAFSMEPTSIGVGLPQPAANAKGIVGSHQSDVTLTMKGITQQKVSAYDDASVTMAALDAQGGALGHTVIASGSPFVTHTAEKAHELTSNLSWTKQGDVYTTTAPTGTYAMTASKATVSGKTISLEEGGSVVLFPVPKGKSAADLAQYAQPLVSTAATSSVDSDTVTTKLAYRTRDDKPTAFVANAVQKGSLDGTKCDLGTYTTVYGELPLCSGTELKWKAPRASAATSLDLSKLTDAEKTTLRPLVTQDIAAIPSPPADTYYGGKWLYRTSQLMMLARDLGLKDDASKAQTLLTNQLVKWTEPKGCEQRDSFCFVYDTSWKGIVGKTVTFDADQFNDHHFHYGYFLYAAGVLASVDPGSVKKIQPVVDLLAADIASPTASKEFPRLRNYDPYASHSWASGTSPFADGNNQESSSEAVNAWAGLELWAKATNRQPLEQHATWLMSNEAEAARKEWLAPDVTSSVYKGFDKKFFGMNWGNKRDYLTWFSAAPQAVLGIQGIPMSPSQAGYLTKVDANTITSTVAEATASGGVNVPLGDYLVMYSALAGKLQAATALTQAQGIPDSVLDNGNSRSYMTAFIMAAGHR